LGIFADRVLGEPPKSLHPVARFGSGMERLEHLWWRDSRAAGTRYFAAGVSVATAAGIVVSHAVTRPYATARLTRLFGGIVACAVAATIATAGRALGEEALRVRSELGAGDLPAARRALRALVGRDTEDLCEAEVVRAVVESVAENTVDAVVAPILWTLVGGAPGCLAYRATNTLDAMVGHRNRRYSNFGWASARADDLANWVPARTTAVLVASVRPQATRHILRSLRTGPGEHPSPNAGIAEAAFAGALGIQVGGESSYGGRAEIRPLLGDGRAPRVADIDRAVALSRDVSLVLAVALLCAVAGGALVRTQK
jgi:adenosylcobinamide-phosphate synthase